MPDTLKTSNESSTHNTTKKNITSETNDNDTIKTIESAVEKIQYIEGLLKYIEAFSALNFYQKCSDENKKRIIKIFTDKVEEIKTSTKIGNIEYIIKFIREGESCCKKIGIDHSAFCNKLKSNETLKKNLLNYLINTKGAVSEEYHKYSSNSKLFKILGMNEKIVNDMFLYPSAESFCEDNSSKMSSLKTKLDKTYNHLRKAHSNVYNIELDLEEAKEKFDEINDQFKVKREEYNEECLKLRESVSRIIESSKNLKNFLNTNGITTEDSGIENIVKGCGEFLKTYTLIEIKAN